MTGVWGNKHGVTDNTYDGADLDIYPDLFTRLRNRYACARLNYSNSHPIVSKGMFGMADFGLVTNDDELAANEAVRQLAQCHPDVLFVHLDEVDGAGHDSGFSADNTEYVEQIVDVDRQVGVVVRAFEQAYPEHDRLIVICTDHGGRGKSHGGMDEDQDVTKVFLIFSTNVQVAFRDTVAEVVDVVPTVFHFLNVPVDTAWALDGKNLLLE